MSESIRRSRPFALLLIVVGLLGLLWGGQSARQASGQINPKAWNALPSDPAGECGAEAGRDGTESAWMVTGGYLHLRLCLADTPGWSKGVTDWTPARYKWWIQVGGQSFMLLLEDATLDSSPQGSGVVSDGAGDLTLIPDLNGDDRLDDDWGSGAGSPAPYLSNGKGHPLWRRAWSVSSGANQMATMGSTRDIGFSLGQASCGPTVEIYVNLLLLGPSAIPCVRWATDPESANLDSGSSCDSGPRMVCLNQINDATPVPPSATPFVPPAPATATAIPPTATAIPPTATAIPPSATAVPPSATAVPPTATTVPATVVAATATDQAPSPTATRIIVPPSATPVVNATATPPPLPATATSVIPTARPSQTPPANLTPVPPPWMTGTPFPTPPGTWPTATPVSGVLVGDLNSCALEVDSTGQSPRPFPLPLTAYAQQVNVSGQPIAGQVYMATSPATGSCAYFAGLPSGTYRTWYSGVPSNYTLYPGTPQSQYVQVLPYPAPCAQSAFRYTLCGYCPNPTACPPGYPCPPGGLPTACPPGFPCPPGGLPTACPPGFPCPPGGLPTACPPGFPCPPTGLPTAWPDSPQRASFGCHSLLPILNFESNDAVCSSWVEVQNTGDHPAKAIMLVWGAPGFCPPQCTGPLKVECSGLLIPGSAWNFLGAQIPTGAKSGAIVSAGTQYVGQHGEDVFADALCEALFQYVVGDCNEFRRFWKAYTEFGSWRGFDFGYMPCQPMAAEVLRQCPGDLRPEVNVVSSYAGIAGEFLGAYDPVYGGYAFYAPSVYAAAGGYNSVLYIQNGGLECTSLEIWFKGRDDCLRPRICDVTTLAPGETFQFDASSCMPAGWVGDAWIRSTQPLGVAVDHIGNDVLMTYTGLPAELNYVFQGVKYFTTGSAVAYGPLIYSEYQGWDTQVIVQNLSRTQAAKVKVYFLDRSGDVITTVVDWVCPQGSQQFLLPVIANLPGNWIGSVRVESQDWFAPGSPQVDAPYIFAIAEMVKYGDVQRTSPQEAMAYEFFPEQMAYDWQVGSGCGGLCSGIGRIGIPSFHKDQAGTGITSEVAIANIVAKPGFTDFAVFIFDQNGLLDFVCEKLHDRQVEYIDLNSWGFINPGFKGSALISATFWEHEVFAPNGGFVRNVVGLAAVKVERAGTTLGLDIPGDESAANWGFPLPGALPFLGPAAPRCPGQPGTEPGNGGGGGGPIPTPPGPPIP